jgi:undecaprenyl-diphosphatase
MIFTSAIFETQGDEFVKMFQVSIQFGAILSVVALYWRKFFDFKSTKFYMKLAIAVIPALVLGKLFDDKIEAVLESPIPIAIVLIAGGFVLLFIDKLFKKTNIKQEEDISTTKALIIGFWQCLAMMPGTSRSAASIIGGMQQGLTRKMAAEFSFFLAVPTMLAVTAYSIFIKDWNYKGIEQKGYEMIMASSDNIINFIIGNVVAFIVGALAIKFFIGFIDKYGFKIWGYYRIIVGTILIFYFTL